MGINLPRKLLHLLFSLFLYLLFLKMPFKNFQIFLGFSLLLFSLWEGLRLKKPHLLPLKSLWEPLLKKKERERITDAFFFLLGVFLCTFISPYKYIGALLLILGFADPVAEISGRLLKGKKLFREKTLEGALSFFFTSLIILALYFGSLSLDYLLLALFLTFVELFSERDNFWIPLAGALFARFFLTS